MLANIHIGANIIPVAANSATGIEPPFVPEAHRRFLKRLFCARVMVGCVEALRRAGFLWSGRFNSAHPITLGLSPFGDGFKPLLREAAMPTTTPLAQARQRFATPAIKSQYNRIQQCLGCIAMLVDDLPPGEYQLRLIRAYQRVKNMVQDDYEILTKETIANG